MNDSPTSGLPITPALNPEVTAGYFLSLCPIFMTKRRRRPPVIFATLLITVQVNVRAYRNAIATTNAPNMPPADAIALIPARVNDAALLAAVVPALVVAAVVVVPATAALFEGDDVAVVAGAAELAGTAELTT